MAKRKRDITTFTLIALAILVWAVAAYFAFSERGKKKAPPAETTSSPARQSAAPTDASNTEAPKTSASAVGSAAKRAAAVDPTSCVTGIFPDGSFPKSEPDFDFVCSETNPLKGSNEVRAQLVLGSDRGVSEAMRLWAGLGWYQFAAFVALGAKCCSTSPQPAFSFDLVCPLHEPLGELASAVRADDGKAVAAALEAYTNQASCLHRVGQGKNMGQPAPPGAGMVGMKKLLEPMGFELP